MILVPFTVLFVLIIFLSIHALITCMVSDLSVLEVV